MVKELPVVKVILLVRPHGARDFLHRRAVDEMEQRLDKLIRERRVLRGHFQSPYQGLLLDHMALDTSDILRLHDPHRTLISEP